MTLAAYTFPGSLSRRPRCAIWPSPALNALLFAVFHLTSPWSWPAFFVMVLPWACVIRWKQSVQLGLFIHVGMLLLQWLGMTLLLFGLVELPA